MLQIEKSIWSMLNLNNETIKLNYDEFSTTRNLEYVKMNCTSAGDPFVVRFEPLFTTNYPDSSLLLMSRFALYALSFECTLGYFYNCELNILAGYQIKYRDNYSYKIASDNSYLDIKCGNRWDTMCFFGYSTGVSLTYVDWYD